MTTKNELPVCPFQQIGSNLLLQIDSLVDSFCGTRLNNKVDALEAELKQAKTPPLVPKTNSTASNGAFTPKNPAS
jgi:hypothetical protein